MAGGISLPAALQLLDGQPHKKVPSAIFENLPLAKVLSGGDMGKLLPKVMADGNLSSVLQNPMAGLTGQLQGLVGQAAQQMQASGAAGASGLVSALTGGSGLGAALSSFQAAGDNLSGVSNGQAGLFSLAGHDGLLDTLASAAPAALAAARVLGPVASADLLGTIAAALPGVVQSVLSGNVSIATATAWVQGQATAILLIVSDSADALAQGLAIQMQVSAVATVAGLVAPVPGVTASTIRLVMATFLTPAAAAAMAEALTEQIRADAHAPVDTAGMTSLK